MSWWHQTLGNCMNVGFALGLIYWPGMMKDAELHIAKFEWCNWFKSKPQRAEMENIQAIYPLQLVHLDYLTIEMTERGKDVQDGSLLIIYKMCTDPGNIITNCKVYSTSFMEPIYSLLWSARMHNLWTRLKFWVTLFQNGANWQEFGSYILVHTMHRQMDNVNSFVH